MNKGNQTAFAGEIAQALNGALNWWRDAGVDCAFADEPQHWITEPPAKTAQTGAPPPRPPAQPPAPEPIARIGGDPADWPQDLPAFTEWWLTEPSLDHGQTEGRVPPRGQSANPALMVLVTQPESEDADHLLSGRQGRLLSAMLVAMGINEAETYIASALPRHTPLADWAGLAAAGLGEVLAHHVALAAPRRIILFGGNVLPLLGNHPAQSAAILPAINQENPTTVISGVPALALPDLAMLLDRPQSKARFWQIWLNWSVQC